MQKKTRGRERPDTPTPVTRAPVSVRRLRWQALKTRGGVVLLACSLFVAGPCQLWKAENRARLGALLGVTGPAPLVSPPSAPFPLSTPLHAPSFTPGTPAAASPRPPVPQATRAPPAPAVPVGANPLPSRPHLAGLLLDYAFHQTPVAVVQVLRFPWTIVLTDPHKVSVHQGAAPDEPQFSAAVPVLAVHAQGPYLAVWIPDPGVLLAPAAARRSSRLQLTILAGAVTRAADGRAVTGSTHVFSVSEQQVAEDLPFLDWMTPEHRRVSGTKATHPSGAEATRASFLVGVGLDLDAPPTPLARIVAQREGHPNIPPGFVAGEAPHGW